MKSHHAHDEQKHNDEYDETNVDYSFGFEDQETLRHRKYVRRRLDEAFELRNLKKSLEDYEGELDEFDWKHLLP